MASSSMARNVNFGGWSATCPFPSHVDIIQDFLCPSTVKELQACLGMVNFFRSSSLASAAPCSCSQTGFVTAGRRQSSWTAWSKASGGAFAKTKQAMLSATHLAHPTREAALSVVAHVSAALLGAGLIQQQLCGSPGLLF
jgi:hypothetical protein